MTVLDLPAVNATFERLERGLPDAGICLHQARE